MIGINVPSTKVTRSTVYKDAGDARLEETEILEEPRPSGAVYLAGYLIECYIKWALCERNGVTYLQELPDKELADKLTSGRGHDLETLCAVSGYANHLTANHLLRRAFQVVAAWSPNIRYVRSCCGRPAAVRFLAAVRKLRTDIQSWASV